MGAYDICSFSFIRVTLRFDCTHVVPVLLVRRLRGGGTRFIRSPVRIVITSQRVCIHVHNNTTSPTTTCVRVLRIRTHYILNARRARPLLSLPESAAAVFQESAVTVSDSVIPTTFSIRARTTLGVIIIKRKKKPFATAWASLSRDGTVKTSLNVRSDLSLRPAAP